MGQRRRVGWTDLHVAPVALGTMQFGWTLSDVGSMALLDRYWKAGGNFIDTADMYGPNQNWRSYERCKPHLGVSEDIIGRWMRDRGSRDAIVVTTKVRSPMWDGPDGQGLSRRHILRAAEDSLRRLCVDHIDLYLAHWPDDDVALEETFSAFATLIDAGKVRYVGTSNYAALGQLDAALSIGAHQGMPRIAAEQLRYNLLNRSEYEGRTQELLDLNNVGTLCYSPLASGFLTGKYRRSDQVLSERGSYVSQYATDSASLLIDRMTEIARVRASSVAAVALAWVLSHESVTSAVVGANSLAQLVDLLPGTSISLLPDEISELDDLGWSTSKAEYTSW